MFCILIQPKGKTEYELFTNEIFNTEKETEDYARRNKFGKDTKWKVVEYEPKYFREDTPQKEWIEGYNKWKEEIYGQQEQEELNKSYKQSLANKKERETDDSSKN